MILSPMTTQTDVYVLSSCAGIRGTGCADPAYTWRFVHAGGGACLPCSEPTMAQRLARARRKIHDAGIPYRVPPADLLPERLDALLAVIYFIFNEGYVTSSGDSLIRHDLCNEAIRLCRILVELLPNSAESRGLLALMLLHDFSTKCPAQPNGRVSPARRTGSDSLGFGQNPRRQRGPG